MIRFLIAVTSNKQLKNADVDTRLTKEEIVLWWKLDALSQIIRSVLQEVRGGADDAVGKEYATTEDLMLTLGFSGSNANGLLELTNVELAAQFELLYNQLAGMESPMTLDKREKLLTLAAMEW